MLTTKHHVVACAKLMPDAKHDAKTDLLMQVVSMQTTNLSVDVGFLPVYAQPAEVGQVCNANIFEDVNQTRR